MDIEYRALQRLEVRQVDDADRPRVELAGYASTFASPYEVDGMIETIERSAFDRTLREKPDVFAFIGHDPSRPIARTTNGSLLLSADDHGLRATIMPIDTQEGRDAVTLVQTGTLDAMSFGFVVKDDKIELRNGKIHRQITDLDLHEVSIVAFPANPSARISTRCKTEAGRLLLAAEVAARQATRRPFLPPNPLSPYIGGLNGSQ